jgi:hypothetical protein
MPHSQDIPATRQLQSFGREICSVRCLSTGKSSFQLTNLFRVLRIEQEAKFPATSKQHINLRFWNPTAAIQCRTANPK